MTEDDKPKFFAGDNIAMKVPPQMRDPKQQFGINLLGAYVFVTTSPHRTTRQAAGQVGRFALPSCRVVLSRRS